MKMTLSARLRQLRERAGLTQEQLAAKSGVNQRTISNMERESQDEVGQRIAELCVALGVGSDFLLGIIQEPEGIEPGAWLVDLERYNDLKSRRGKPQGDLAWAVEIPSSYSVATAAEYERLKKALTKKT